MKRSAAILGPTPAFLSWTIVRNCSLRSVEARKPVAAAFQELRSLRALAVGEIEQRVVEGFCLHPDAAEMPIEDVKGFPVDEIYAALGGQQAVCESCRNCDANVGVSAPELESATDQLRLSRAGCFGWLPFGEHSENANVFLRLLQSNQESSTEPCPVAAFQEAIESATKPNPFSGTSPGWYGVWSHNSFSNTELKFLANVCDSVRCDSLAWKRLARAVKQACQHDLPFHCQLMPPGHSDGVHWTVGAQCRGCGSARGDSPCPVCGDDSVPTRSRKMKVLGLRPYLKLSTIVGEAGVAKLVEGLRQD